MVYGRSRVWCLENRTETKQIKLILINNLQVFGAKGERGGKTQFLVYKALLY